MKNKRYIKKKSRFPDLREYQLLEALARHPGQVLSREELIVLAWGYTTPIVGPYLYYSITAKVEEDPRQPRYILTTTVLVTNSVKSKDF